MKHIMEKVLSIFVIIALSTWAGVAMATAKIDLLDISTKLNPGGQAQIILSFSGQAVLPTEFSMDDPSTMVFDFSAVSNKLAKTDSLQRLASGVVKEINFVEVDHKIRMIVDVIHVVPFKTERDGNNIIITLEGDTKVLAAPVAATVAVAATGTTPTAVAENNYNIKAIDFRRGEDGEGRLIIELSSDAAPIDFHEADNEMVLEYAGATIPEKLLRRFDVGDFGTPIKRVVVMKQGNSVLFKIQAVGEYDKVAYQSNKQYVIEIKPVTAQEKEAVKAQKFKFTGERISLNFQDIEVRAVLQLLADFTGLNIIASDSVTGHVTLKLDNVPWDQALDFILKSKGLGKRESGNVIMIAPNEELAAKEKLELETIKQAETLSPLQAEQFQINYAKATNIMKMIQSKDNTMLSSKGVISVDDRTNILFVKDTVEKLAEIEKLLEKLDVPVRQVLIEAQIVSTTDNFTDLFGIMLGGTATPKVGKYGTGIGGTANNARTMADARFNGGPNQTTKMSTYAGTINAVNGGAVATATQAGAVANAAAGIASNTATTTTTTGTSSSSSSSSTSTTDPLQFFNFSQPTAGGAGLGLAVARLPGGTLLNLELQASETESKTKVLARPKLMTLDQQKSSIETGVDIPYTTTAQNGSTPTTTFKKAVLKLEVTPQITPNNKVQMLLSVNQDSQGDTINGQSGINTTSLTTNILVDNGETVVLGGIFQVFHTKTVNRIPFLSDLPFIGRLFKDNAETDKRSEILIFVTPRVIKEAVMD